MADEIEATDDQPLEEESQAEDSGVNAEEDVTVVSESGETAPVEDAAADAGTTEDAEKSAEEAAAEEAMLAMMEGASTAVAEPEESAAESEPAPGNLDLLMDVALQVTVELGRKEMRFSEILQLGKGSLVELNKVADEPVDIYVNQSKVAEGEVVVVDDHFGVRITKLLNDERAKKME